MIELLHSAELAEAMTALQAETAETLRAQAIVPKLGILEGLGTTALTTEINTYVRGKLRYMEKVGIETAHLVVPLVDIPTQIERFNADPAMHAAIVELPLPFKYIGNGPEARKVHKDLTAIILDKLDGAKAIDSQGKRTHHKVGATAEAAITLLDHHGYTGEGEHVLIVGKGNVGGSVHDVYSRRPVRELSVVDLDNLHELPSLAKDAGMIVVATGTPGTFTPDLVREGHIIAGVGAKDIHPDVYDIADVDFSVTPPKGGVGPVTIRITGGRVLSNAAQLVMA